MQVRLPGAAFGKGYHLVDGIAKEKSSVKRRHFDRGQGHDDPIP
jgi:hypothetical protein